MTKTLYAMLSLVSSLWMSTACNSNVQPKNSNANQTTQTNKPPTSIVPKKIISNDTTAIVQAILDSKILYQKFYYKFLVLPKLYSSVTIRRRHGPGGEVNSIDSAKAIPENTSHNLLIDTIVEMHLTDSFFTYKCQQIKLSSTPYDLPALPFDTTNHPKQVFDFVIGVVIKSGKNKAKFAFKFDGTSIDLFADLKKIKGKWEVISYEELHKN